MCPFCRRRGACRKRASLSPIMVYAEANDAKIASHLEASKFLEYPRHAYITICGTTKSSLLPQVTACLREGGSLRHHTDGIDTTGRFRWRH